MLVITLANTTWHTLPVHSNATREFYLRHVGKHKCNCKVSHKLYYSILHGRTNAKIMYHCLVRKAVLILRVGQGMLFVVLAAKYKRCPSCKSCPKRCPSCKSCPKRCLITVHVLIHTLCIILRYRNTLMCLIVDSWLWIFHRFIDFMSL